MPAACPEETPVIWLDANESPYRWPTRLLAEAWEVFQAQGPHRYPRHRGQLNRALASYAGVPEDWVLPGNGSDELIVALLCSLGRKVDSIILPWPTFAFYRQLAWALDLPVTLLDLAGDFSLPQDDLLARLEQEDRALVVLCRPNNPTGNLFRRPAVVAALDAGAWVVVDEAYYEFSGETVADLLGRYPRLLVLRTLSKAFALAGLRVGYALGHPDVLARLKSVLQPYNVDSFSLAAAQVALRHARLTQGWVRATRSARERLARDLEGVPGVRPWPSRANFLLVEVLPGAGRQAREAVEGLARAGVRVRYWPEEPRLRHFFRVTVGVPRENAIFVEQLRLVLGV